MWPLNMSNPTCGAAAGDVLAVGVGDGEVGAVTAQRVPQEARQHQDEQRLQRPGF